MRSDTEYENTREIVREEMQKFAHEFLPGLEETIRFMQKVTVMEKQVESLEIKMGNVKKMLSNSIVHLEELAKTIKDQNIRERGSTGAIGENVGIGRKLGSIRSKKKDFIQEIERVDRFERDFANKLGLTSNSPTKRLVSRRKGEKIGFEKRILKLESEQVRIQELMEKKLDLMIKEIQKAARTNIRNKEVNYFLFKKNL